MILLAVLAALSLLSLLSLARTVVRDGHGSNPIPRSRPRDAFEPGRPWG
ncbi:MAG: hypothetical protein QM621_07265 [Aeromicrobium sp.]